MNYKETKEILKQYLLARIPFISINTIEKKRALNILKEIAEETRLNINVSSMSKGIIDITSNTLINDSKTAAGVLDFISNEIKKTENRTYVLTDFNDLSEENTITRYLSDVVTSAEEHSSTIIVISSAFVTSELQRLGMAVELSLPNQEELLELTKNYINSYSSQIKVEWNDEDFKEAATILLGLSEIEVKNVLSALIVRGYIKKDDLVELRYTKDNMFSEISGLEKIKVDSDIVFGGLENLKEWLESKYKLMTPAKREEMKERGMNPPRGILMVGVPGCGKSLAAKAISAKWKLPLYLLDFATVQGRYVGQSEQQLNEALEMAESVSPCILWIDEIEKGLSGLSEDNGVSNRMLGQFLFWLQECDKEVFVVATANSIEKLPPELVRKGRFDEIFFVDLPNNKEREEILKLYITKYLKVNVQEEFLKQLVDITKGFSGADLEASIREMAYKMISGETQLTPQLFVDTLTNTISLSKTNQAGIEKIQNWGKQHALSASKQQ